MADKDETAKGAASKKPEAVAVRLSADAPAAQPVLANYARAGVANGLVLVDFGFLEPGVLAALSATARKGGAMPKAVAGRLSARVAMPADAARALHAQLGRVHMAKLARSSVNLNTTRCGD